MGRKVFVLDQTSIKKLLTIYKLTIPDFQRNFVWKQAKKQQLLESLFRGFPIGAITLYEDDGTYYIIDGLQRINTLNQYLSCPSAVISFGKFWDRIEESIKEFLTKNSILVKISSLKKSIKVWYESLKNLYEFEKVSVLYKILLSEKKTEMQIFDNLNLVEDLLDILRREIEIVHDDIALIIYRGDKNDLPDLFKNINTGSVALSQYEILQSVWNSYILDKDILKETYLAFDRELELIRSEYEIDAVREQGIFDIFKNIVGLNHLICCNEQCDKIFKFSGFKKLSNPLIVGNNIKKYYANDSISFELYSTILCNSPNQIVKAIDMIFNDRKDMNQVSFFINKLNQVILEAICIAIEEVKSSSYEIIESKYHSLYVLAGIIISKYDIDIKNLSIDATVVDKEIFQYCLNLQEHLENNWFVDENRQVGFFNIRIDELHAMKKERQQKKLSNKSIIKQETSRDILSIMIENDIITAYTVKDFYRKIFEYLIKSNISFEEYVPYATGKKRYLINKTMYHLNGSIFVAPISIGSYYVETHKSKMAAIKDIYKFLETIGVHVTYVV